MTTKGGTADDRTTRLRDLDPDQGVFVVTSFLSDPASIICFDMDDAGDLAFDDGSNHDDASDWVLLHLHHLLDAFDIGHLPIWPGRTYQRVGSAWVAIRRREHLDDRFDLERDPCEWCLDWSDTDGNEILVCLEMSLDDPLVELLGLEVGPGGVDLTRAQLEPLGALLWLDRFPAECHADVQGVGGPTPWWERARVDLVGDR